jgi:hypothetical protein
MLTRKRAGEWKTARCNFTVEIPPVLSEMGPRSTVVKVLRYKSEGRWFDGVFH